MHTQMLTTKDGAQLLSFKINGEEKIHQGEEFYEELRLCFVWIRIPSRSRR